MVESRVVSRRQRHGGNKKRRWPRRLLIVLLIIVLIVIAYGVYVYYKADSALNDSQVDLGRSGGKSALRDAAVRIGKDPISILILGIENYSTDGQNGRADSQILVTVNPKTNKMKIVTIPRDSRVQINHAGQYTGMHKINAAYTYGDLTGYGADKLQVETVEKMLDVPIDKFVAVDFDGFRDIVDILSPNKGIKINIKQGFYEKDIYNHGKRIYFQAGPAHLNGEQALAFVRMRKRAVNATYSRDERQRQFLRAVINQAISARTIFKVGAITDILGKHVDTNLDANEIYALERQYSSMKKSSIKTTNIGGQNENINGVDYFIPDGQSLQNVSNKLRKFLNLRPDPNFSTNADTQ